MTENQNDTRAPRTTLAPPASAPDKIVACFDAAWQSDKIPQLADFLNGAECRELEVAAELVRIDMQQRTKRGESVLLDSYLADVPEFLDSPLELIALILDEYSIRTEAGQHVDYEEYRLRFPEHANTIRIELGLTDDLAPSVTEETATIVPSRDVDPDATRDSTWNENDEDASEASRESTGDEFQPGTIVDDFEIERLLGQGGVSKVFLARQISLNRAVALKVTIRDADDERASDEGRAMAAVVHDHIVPVHTEFRIGSRHVLAMGYVSGPALSQFLEALRLTTGSRWLKRSESECRQIIADLSGVQSTDSSQTNIAGRQLSHFAAQTVRDLARALAHAHESGILHCDIKPANILLSPGGRALLTDFNVSVRKGPDSAEDQFIPAGGTLMYMAPEQLALLTGSQVSRVDERSDVYSLGLVLFELLTGSWPFPDENLSDRIIVAAGQLQANRLSTNLIYPDDAIVPLPLRSILEKCLQPLPGDRYQSAAELADDLNCFLIGNPLRRTANAGAAVFAGCLKRHRIALLISAACVLLALVVIRTFQDDNQKKAASSTVAATERRLSNARDALSLADEGRRHIENRSFASAVPVLKKAVELNQQLVPAWHNLGVAQFRLSNFSAAEASFDKVIELGNRSGVAYSHRAVARFAVGDIAGADADFADAMRVALPTERAEVIANLQQFEARRAIDRRESDALPGDAEAR